MSDFDYRKSDVKLLILCVLLAAIVLTITLSKGIIYNTIDEDTAVTADTFKKAQPERRTAISYYDNLETRAAGELFEFDPNTADSSALRRLGLSKRVVYYIYKYRARGGVYQCAEDFGRTYGLTRGEYRRLKPYVRISDDFLPAATLEETHKTFAPTETTTSKMREGEVVDLSLADTTALKSIPGVGSYTARKIVEYGARLGGYVAKEQLLDLETFPSTALPYVTLSEVKVTKLNVNTARPADLRRHPYLSYLQVRELSEYRRLHGPLHSISELSRIKEFKPEDIERLKPYLDF